MPRTLSLRLLPLLLASLFTVLCSTVAAQDAGVQIRGPKTTDSSPIKQYGPINNADTLWKIALMVRPDPRFSVYQVMQALYVNNPQAFKENNLNHLVNGQYLKIPSYDDIASIDPQQAQAKSDADDNVWEKKVKSAPKIVAKKATPANVVQKKDLEQAKSEINEQLQDIGKSQEQRLETIQNDVLDSIDGLQAILQENEKLKSRLSNFDSQLGEMQQEVAKSEEMKVQMDALIKLQQELLDKANAREQELMIEKQKAALEDDNFTSSIWFTFLVATVPAVLIVSLIAFFLLRRKSDDKPVEVETKAPVKETEVKKEAAPEAEELALDGELSLDDELAIDLTEDESLDDLDGTELGGDELFSDDLDDLDDELLDDDVIHLDDDLDDLEDISLDDLGDEQPLDDSIELADDDIDDLLEQTPEEEEDQTLDGGELGQDMLDDLLSGLEITEEGSDDSALEQSAEEAPSNTEDDIDALLDEVTDEQDTSADAVSDPDDIDSLLDQVSDEIGAEEPSPQQDVKDPDDIDSLLDEINEEVSAEEPSLQEDVTDPDDIDSLLDEINEEVSAEEPSLQEDVTDPDDIDSLLAEVSAETPSPQEEVTEPDDIDALLDEIGAEEPSLQEDVTDPDDIDSLLDEINEEVSSEEPSLQEDVTDPDDIDSLLDEINEEVSAEEPSLQEDVTDPDDIDSLLDEINEEVSSEEPSLQEDVTDPDDIDSLLDEINEEVSAEEPSLQEDVTDPDDIDSLLDEINDEVSEEESSLQEDVTDPDDIDSLLDEISGNDESDIPTSKVELTDPDDIDALLSSFDDAPAESNDAKLIEDDVSDVSDSESHDELNTQDIDNFTEEHVGQFLTMDFSGVGQETVVDNDDIDEPITLDENDDEEQEILDVDDILDAIQVEEVASAENSILGQSDAIEDDIVANDTVADEAAHSDNIDLEELDVEQLLADVSDESTTATEDLLDGVNEQTEEVEAPFDESTLSHLLNETDTPAHDEPVELTPDFTDSNVLADLLSDGEVTPKAEAAEASEIEDIQELNNLDFDELLANIEEENAPSTLEEPIVEDVIEDLDIGDDLVAIEEDDNEPADFVSVDSLITDSLEPEASEPYKSENIDVGLNEFPEFAGDDTDIDEEDTNGVAAKLDLAKVYIEIGDEENAEVILQDVIKLGDAQQQFEAQQLLGNLS
ncbi:FimV/HubP family polar landmark protein [Thalassotalea eurytherma]|uniref:Pilus assembly protein FimV n=1 Tax=Thalassotalea eurytherma TaxID=1144278 RepID=A0ABQ6H794_9GAMM|nr:FimV/HubP family polar landmark protein [Thalassotalea eurytherma]GLX82630.1 hypothetical protein theurythT_20820 [Thalassotalea eurytherma]